MAVKVNIQYERTIHSPNDVQKTYEYFLDYPSAIKSNFPYLEEFEETAPSVYRWKFRDFHF